MLDGDKHCVEKQRQEENIGNARVEITVLNKVIRKILPEKVLCEQRLEENKGMSMEIFGQTAFQAEESVNAKTLKWCLESLDCIEQEKVSSENIREGASS